MAAERTFSFAEIVKGRDSSVRVTDDNMFYAVDLVMVGAGLARDQAGLTLRRLSNEKPQSIKMIDRQFSSRGGYKTKLVSFQDGIKLIMRLPGNFANETRAKFTDIITRYLAGDSSLITEVEANGKSASPIAQMARASLAAEAAAPDALSLKHKRKLEELEISRLEAEIESMKRVSSMLVRDSGREHMEKCTKSYRELCEDTVMDERARLVFKDNFLNMAMLQGPAAITNGEPGGSSNKPTSLSLVASEMGLKIPIGDLISIGAKLKKRYEEEHGKPPSKHDQLCNGRMTKVNSYTEADRQLIEAVLREWKPRA